MSMMHSSSSSAAPSAIPLEAAAYGGFIDALGEIVTIVLAIVGLSGVKPEPMLSIATIVFGAALLIQGGAMLGEFAQIDAPLETGVASGGTGVSALFLVGAAGIVLGILALLGVFAPVLTAAAVIAFGAALLISSSAVWRLLTSPAVTTGFGMRSPLIRIVASEIAAGSAGLQAMAGLAVTVLGILAVCGVFVQQLNLIALLVAGAAILLTGSTLSGTMIGFMRPAKTTVAVGIAVRSVRRR